MIVKVSEDGTLEDGEIILALIEASLDSNIITYDDINRAVDVLYNISRWNIKVSIHSFFSYICI